MDQLDDDILPKITEFFFEQVSAYLFFKYLQAQQRVHSREGAILWL